MQKPNKPNTLDVDNLYYNCERLFRAARNYYMLKEVGKPYDNDEFLYDEKIKDEMFRAILNYKMDQYPFELNKGELK